MEIAEDPGLDPESSRRLAAMLARDPLLERELELIVPALAPDRAAVFWRALAERTDESGIRPASAVLEALVRAARTG